MIVLSVAHTRRAQGARSPSLTEYEISKVSSRIAFDALYSAGIPCALMELGWFAQVDSIKPKQRMPSGALLAVEIHCNGSENQSANYAETIYHSTSFSGKKAATAIIDALARGFAAGNHGRWPSKGPRADDSLFFLRGPAPAVIVEGVFISNPEQAAWLASNGGCEAYGLLVAEGIKSWWSTR